MNSKTLWNQQLSMLAACGSPGSALAYHLGQSIFETGLPRRNTTTGDTSQAAAQEPAQGGAVEQAAAKAGPHVAPRRNWFARAFHRLESWSWEREVREREAYLSRSQDLSDLEARMRRIDSNLLAPGCPLR
jgi:Protein of unknown function (DUF3563)